MAAKYDFPVTRSEDVKKTLVENLVVDPEKFNLRWKMPSEGKLRELANDIKNDPSGQKNPIAVYITEGKPYVVEGFCRAAAMKLINADEFDAGKDLTPIKFRIINNKTELVNIFLSNVGENVVRFELTILDKAYGMNRLYNDFKMSQADIAARYKVSQGTVSNYLKLLTLPDDLKNMIHEGNLSLSEATELSRVNPSKLGDVLKKMEESKELPNPVGSSKVDKVGSAGNVSKGKGKVKDAIQAVTGKRFKRTVGDFVDMTGIEESEEKPKIPYEYFKILNYVCRWFDGDVDTPKLLNYIATNFEYRGKK